MSPPCPELLEQKLCCWVCCTATPHLALSLTSLGLCHRTVVQQDCYSSSKTTPQKCQGLVCSTRAELGARGRHLSPERSVRLERTDTSGSFMMVTFCIFFLSSRAKLIRNALEQQLVYRDHSPSARRALSSGSLRANLLRHSTAFKSPLENFCISGCGSLVLIWHFLKQFTFFFQHKHLPSLVMRTLLCLVLGVVVKVVQL